MSVFKALLFFLRKKSECYRPNKAEILTEEEVIQLLLEAEGHTWLLENVEILIIVDWFFKHGDSVCINASNLCPSRTD